MGRNDNSSVVTSRKVVRTTTYPFGIAFDGCYSHAKPTENSAKYFSRSDERRSAPTVDQCFSEMGSRPRVFYKPALPIVTEMNAPALFLKKVPGPRLKKGDSGPEF